LLFMRITHILCPTDGSEAAASALDYAVAIGGWYKGRLTVLHVTEAAATPADIAKVERETAAARELAAAAGATVEVIVTDGDPARAIVREAARQPADLVVIGTHGRGGFQRLILGSVTEKVLRSATAPVLTIPPGAGGKTHLPVRRVVCGIDFSACSLAALEYARSLARESQASLILVHAIEWPWEEPPAPTFDELPRAEAAALRTYRRTRELQATARLSAVAPLRTGGECPAVCRVVHGKAYAGVLRVVEEEHADLIVLGVGGRSGADRLVFGSTTNQIVRQAACPVLTVRR
jgi:nucleotide-binding universal stress UspA family protein